jgi:ParB-like chromosome segregation protein Spo0J
MEEDGFTQPIIAQRKTREFVDGEHRWTAAIVLNYLQRNKIPVTLENINKARDRRYDIIDPELKIPVVFVDMEMEQMKISTLRHNKARGSHDIELEAQLLKDLQELGAGDWAQDSLLLSDEEMNKMLEDIPVAEALANDEYSTSWVPDELNKDDLAMVANGSTEAREVDGVSHGGKMITAVSHNAINTISDRQVLLSKAKTEEEKQMAKLQTKLYRISLIFANEEAEIIETVLGKEPAVKLLDMCKKALSV